MTHAERKALREKHSQDLEMCSFCDAGPLGKNVEYPCDVIKVLDAYEEFIVPLKEKQ